VYLILLYFNRMLDTLRLYIVVLLNNSMSNLLIVLVLNIWFLLLCIITLKHFIYVSIFRLCVIVLLNNLMWKILFILMLKICFILFEYYCLVSSIQKK
jgi:hypothetical protein